MNILSRTRMDSPFCNRCQKSLTVQLRATEKTPIGSTPPKPPKGNTPILNRQICSTKYEYRVANDTHQKKKKKKKKTSTRGRSIEMLQCWLQKLTFVGPFCHACVSLAISTFVFGTTRTWLIPCTTYKKMKINSHLGKPRRSLFRAVELKTVLGKWLYCTVL